MPAVADNRGRRAAQRPRAHRTPARWHDEPRCRQQSG